MLWYLKYANVLSTEKKDDKSKFMELMVTSGEEGERDRLEVWDWHVPTAIFKIDNQQGPIVTKINWKIIKNIK